LTLPVFNDTAAMGAAVHNPMPALDRIVFPIDLPMNERLLVRICLEPESGRRLDARMFYEAPIAQLNASAHNAV
jgi:hypothetical protein